MPNEDIDYVKEASTLGWVPQDKWTGDPEKWVDAEDYVKKGETIMPILIQDKRKLAEEVRKQKEALEQMRGDVASFKKMSEAAAEKEKAELKAEIAALKAERAQAITDGEGAKVVEIEEEIAAKEKEIKDTAPSPKDEKSVHPDYPAWHAENKWYGEDQKLTKLANAFAMQIASDNPGLQGKAFYDKISEEIYNLPTYQTQYGEKDRKPINKVEGDNDTSPSGSTGTRGGAKGYNELPPEAKAACERYIKNGWFSDKKYKTVDEKRKAYASDYYASL